MVSLLARQQGSDLSASTDLKEVWQAWQFAREAWDNQKLIGQSPQSQEVSRLRRSFIKYGHCMQPSYLPTSFVRKEENDQKVLSVSPNGLEPTHTGERSIIW